MTTTTQPEPRPRPDRELAHRRPPAHVRRPGCILGGALAVVGRAIFGVLAARDGADFNIARRDLRRHRALHRRRSALLALLVEGRRQATDRLVTALVVARVHASRCCRSSRCCSPCVTNGLARFDLEFFTNSMRNVVGEGGGALHAIVGTLLITGWPRRSSRCRSAC